MTTKTLLFSALLFIATNSATAQATISGKIFNDADHNLAAGAGEGLAGINIWLFNMADTTPNYRVMPIAQATTNANGDYQFTVSNTGDFQLRVQRGSLPATLSNIVKDPDAFADGVSIVTGVTGSNTYANRDFGFAAASTAPSFTSSRRFVWSGSTAFPGGQTSNTYALTPELINGVNFTPSITWSTNKICAPTEYQPDVFPQAMTNVTFGNNWPGAAKGGFQPLDSTFNIIYGGAACYNAADSDRQVTSIAFSNPVKNVRFSIYDIDVSTPQTAGGRLDFVRITGYNGTTPVYPVIVNPSSVPYNSVSGNTVIAIPDYATDTIVGLAFNSNNDDHGTVNVYFANTITSVKIEYEEWAPVILTGKGASGVPSKATTPDKWATRVPTPRGISIGGVDYTIDPVFVLPIKFVEVSVTEQNCINILKWKAAFDEPPAGFYVEKSTDGVQFIPAKFQPYLPGKFAYTFTDEANASNYYRLKVREQNGNITYSAVVHSNTRCSAAAGLQVMPNPVANKTLNFTMRNVTAGTYSLNIFTADGKKIYTQPFKVNGDATNLQKTLLLPQPAGNYILQIVNAKGTITEQTQFVMQ